MKIVSKNFCTFAGVYTAIHMSSCCRSYNLLVQKFWTSEMLDKWSPTSKLSDVKFSHYSDGRHIFFTCTTTRLSAIPIKPVFWYLRIFSPVYDRILNIGWHVNFSNLGVSLWLPTFCIIFPMFLRTGISPDFTWIFIDWVSVGCFSRCIFSLA